jgi:hypothetical protein
MCLILLSGCANRPSIAARATVENFYGAVQNDNLDLLDDNLAAMASPQFRDQVHTTAAAAQLNPDVRRSVQVVTIGPPSIDASSARVQVDFANGQSNTVTLVREGLRWKVLTTGTLG